MDVPDKSMEKKEIRRKIRSSENKSTEEKKRNNENKKIQYRGEKSSTEEKNPVQRREEIF